MEKELPQLIVALDSDDDSANFVHIADVRKNNTYYCPCCKGIVKPRAYKKENEYKVQPHYYHVTGGCTEESYIHYMCKTNLISNGSIFIVSGEKYKVLDYETEKTLHTTFGDYRPDIIVNTTSGKTFYFEILYSNKKTSSYIPKWDELGCDVVEVDARKLINCNREKETPIFNLIYSDGKCFIKSYSHTDYDETIAKRKIEWKRQDKINYKIQWEKLDWIWIKLHQYKSDLSGKESVIDAFSCLEFEDMDFVMTIVKKMKCIDLFDDLICVINKKVKYELREYFKKYHIETEQTSPRIFSIIFTVREDDLLTVVDSIQIRKNVKYFNKEVYDAIVSIKDADTKIPHYTKINSLICNNKIKKDIHIFMNLHSKCLTIKRKNESVYFYRYDKWYTMYDEICWKYIRPIIAYPNSKKQKIDKKIDNICDIYLKIEKIINSCGNKFWKIEIDSTSNKKICVRLYVDNVDYYISAKLIYLTYLDNLNSIFSKIKGAMIEVINDCNCMYSGNEIRVMEVLNDK